MMRWIIISEDYLSFLRKNEPRIPRSQYATNQFKPFLGVLFETEDYYYVTQVSSVKDRHNRMKQNIDFFKLYDKNNKLIAVINLNYMFPVPKSEITDLEYEHIQDYRTFDSEKQKSQYVHFLKLEMQQINKMSIGKAAERLKKLQEEYPDSSIAERCIDFVRVEKLCKQFIKDRALDKVR